MSVATSHKNFVGGEWVDAVDGKDMSMYSVEEYAIVEHVMAKID